eukprot:1260786-Rhodomonas_salina.1
MNFNRNGAATALAGDTLYTVPLPPTRLHHRFPLLVGLSAASLTVWETQMGGFDGTTEVLSVVE